MISYRALLFNGERMFQIPLDILKSKEVGFLFSDFTVGFMPWFFIEALCQLIKVDEAGYSFISETQSGKDFNMFYD